MPLMVKNFFISSTPILVTIKSRLPKKAYNIVNYIMKEQKFNEFDSNMTQIVLVIAFYYKKC